MKLVIAEKPSVARDLAKALGVSSKKRTHFEGAGLRITWCFGHMCELAEPVQYNPDWKKWRLELLPMVPEKFDINVRKDTKEHWEAIAKLIRANDVTEIVNACDAGREGELIFRYVIQSAGEEKPTSRLWVSSMTTEAIQHAWDNLQPGSSYDRLADAARCRSESDWLVGLNATRAMTCMVQKTTRTKPLSIGRVQTPTLAMIVSRDIEISNFVSEDFWRVEGLFSPSPEQEQQHLNAESPPPNNTDENTNPQPNTWTARWFRQDKNSAIKDQSKGKEIAPEVSKAERLTSEADAKLIEAACQGKKGTLVEATHKEVTEKTPLLYDLNALQQKANQRFGFSAQKTLDLAQALYETHKIITYPRTDGRYLLPDQMTTIPPILEQLKDIAPYRTHIEQFLDEPLRSGKRIFNAKEVGDHHAIIPTGKSPMKCHLNADEKRIFDLVARRLLAVFSPDAKFSASKLVVSVETDDAPLPSGIVSPLTFQAKGKVCLNRGWQLIDTPPPKKERELPQLTKGQTVFNHETSVHKGQTRPPKNFNEASLLGAMESAGKELKDSEMKRAMRSAGLGTPATRASIIETLLNRNFIERKKRHIKATELGVSLIQAITVDELKSAELTGRWEARLNAIAEGQDTRAEFMKDVSQHVHHIIETIKSSTPPNVPALAEDFTEEELGVCPKCATPVRMRGPVFTCDTGRSCEFVIFNTIASRKISKRMVKQLLTKGHTSHVKGFKSKKSGNTFEASLRLNSDGKVVFDFSQTPSKSKSSTDKTKGQKPPAALPTSQPFSVYAGAPCPNCQTGQIIQGKQSYGCNQWHAGCKTTFPITTPVGMSCPSCKIGHIIQGKGAWGCNQYSKGCTYVLNFKDGTGKALSASEAIKAILNG